MSAPLTQGQKQFVSHLSALTGLNPGVLTAWALAEESGGAAQARQAADNHNWLNIGYFDSGPGQITQSQAFKNPVTAAQATAKFLKGQWGGASTGIQSILNTVGHGPMPQINAIANSGWASSGYNHGQNLRSLFYDYGKDAPGAAASTGAPKVPGQPSAPQVGRPHFSVQRSGGKTNWGAALTDALLQTPPINVTTGTPSDTTGLLQRAEGLVSSDPTSYVSPVTTKIVARMRALGGGRPSQAGASAPATVGKGYLNPLEHVNHWERTDMGVDANMPVGAPIVAPGRVKIMGVSPDWYAGQPYVYYKLLDGPDKGKIQYVAEQIDHVAPVGSVLQRGDTIARYAPTGTGIEFGWGAPGGQTEAQATTGYSEGQITRAGLAMKKWLDSLGAKDNG